MSFADRVISFNSQLTYTGSKLPDKIRIMNPFQEIEEAMPVVKSFYHRYYDDDKPRHIILGINPGRFGGGLTGIPFTDPKRLSSECGIVYEGKMTHEPSSVFIYDIINAYGGAERFYGDFYINSVCPLGFTSINSAGKEINYNYYDSKELTNAVYHFIVASIRKQISMGIKTDVCICLGTGKNEEFLRALNEEYNFFGEIIALEHPRYIMQYKAKFKNVYIEKYVSALGYVEKTGKQLVKA
ncbi:MAG TPA: uracil-DNA glycosylase family protein [Puia sp.]|nr:uracil-DNA glycosylase family protein [Puia sp.]